MLLPKRVKRRRVHRGRMKGKAMRGNTLAYGEFVPSYLVGGDVLDAPRKQTGGDTPPLRRMVLYDCRGGVSPPALKAN